MSNAYKVSLTNGSSNYSNYLYSNIVGPLNTNKYPFSMRYHKHGKLNGINPTPPSFFSYQEPINSNMNTNCRQTYVRTIISKNKEYNDRISTLEKMNNGKSYYHSSTGKYFNTLGYTNYIKPLQSSSYVDIKKSKHIGKSSYKVGLSNDDYITSKNISNNTVRTHLRRARSSGCVAPKKKGSLFKKTF